MSEDAHTTGPETGPSHDPLKTLSPSDPDPIKPANAQEAKEEVLTKLPDHFTCPRRAEGFGPLAQGEMKDTWVGRDDGFRHCSYCGSIPPDDFMRYLEAGEQLIPTDKSYKAYLRLRGDGVCRFCNGTNKNPQDQSTPCPMCRGGVSFSGPEVKFYFRHLSMEQKVRLVAMVNERKIAFGEPGHFYRLPYFVAPLA